MAKPWENDERIEAAPPQGRAQQPQPRRNAPQRPAQGQQAAQGGQTPWQRDTVVSGDQTQQQVDRGSDDGGFFPFVNRSIAEIVGAPVDIGNYMQEGVGHYMRRAVGLPGMEEEQREAIRTPGGSETIRSGMEAIGADPAPEGAEPETFGESIGQGVGDAAATLPFFGMGGAAMQAARSPVVRSVGRTLTRPFVSQPVRATTAETAAGAGAGAGREAAGRADPGSPLSRTAGEFAGGAAAAMGPGAAIRGARRTAEALPVTGTAIRGVRAALFPFTEAGGKVRASRRLRDLSGDPEAQAQALEEESIGGLTPAQQTGNERLMALERAVLDKDASLDDQFKEQTAQASQRLRDALREPAEEMGAEEVRQGIAQRRDYLLNLMDQRVAQAVEGAQQKIARLEPQRKASESSTIVRDELESALKTARQQESRLWDAVPDEAEVPTDNLNTTYKALRDNLPRAQRDEMPSMARRLLGGAEEDAEGEIDDLVRRVFGQDAPAPSQNRQRDKFGVQETVREMQGLRSRLLSDARKARASGDFNTARLADELSNAILDDLGAGATEESAVGRMIDTARSFSAGLNERFRQGSVGRVLGYAREGGAAVPPETTLDTTIGRGGTRAAVEADEIRRAVEESPGDAQAATQDYITRRFSDYANRGGQLDARRAQEFVRRNDELLDRFPGLKRQMRDAEQAQTLAERETRTAGARAQRLRDPKQSRAAQFLDAPVDQEIETVLRSRNPREAARELRRQVSKDRDAARGLKGAFFDFLTRRARTAEVDESGENILSGRKLQNILNDSRTGAVAEEILDKGERNRLQRIIGEMRNLETAQRRLPNVGEAMEDLPNSVISMIGRTLAARAGAQAGAGTSGASLLTAQFASQRVRNFLNNLTNDRAEALIRDAVTGDRELFMALLRGVDDKRSAKYVERRLAEWLEGYAGTQVGEAARENGNGSAPRRGENPEADAGRDQPRDQGNAVQDRRQP